MSASGRLFLVALLTLVAAALAFARPAPAALPKVVVKTDGAIPDRGPKTSGRIAVRAPSGGWKGAVGIEVRGSFSRSFPKRSYAFETRGRGKEGRAVALLGMPAESDWVLNGAYDDGTLLRDALAYATSRRLGRWAPRTEFVELYLNGRYDGVYVLTEQIKLDKRRADVSGKGISGRYLLEWSNEPKKGGFRGVRSGARFVHHDPERDDLSRAEAAWIARYVERAERALYGEGGDWRAFVDERAAVDHLLLQELFKNWDAFLRSVYLTKGAGRKLELGPVWDFDRAMGSTSGAFGSPEGWASLSSSLGDAVSIPRPWAPQLLGDRRFVDQLAARWRELRAAGLLAAVLEDAARMSSQLAGARERNTGRWPQRPGDDARGLRTWLAERAAWIDANVASPSAR